MKTFSKTRKNPVISFSDTLTVTIAEAVVWGYSLKTVLLKFLKNLQEDTYA